MADGAMSADNSEKALAGDKAESARAWLEMLEQSRQHFAYYNQRADHADKLFADLKQLATYKTDTDPTFSMFWANMQVLMPSIYARPPVPVAVPRFKDNKPIPSVASEMLERSLTTMLDLEDIDEVMRQVRDDLAIIGRGMIRVRYVDDNKKGERLCLDHQDRYLFRQDVARNWKEVGWVAFGAWLSEDEAKERFSKYSGDAYKKLGYQTKRDSDNDREIRLKALVWEIWSKIHNKVIWVGEGCDVVLEKSDPHLTLEGFFPCPRPAYGTLERRTLIPVPDMLQYRSQLDEINWQTRRIMALTRAVKARALYPSGAGELSDAIEQALKLVDDEAMVIPLANWPMNMGSLKEALVWLPIDMIVAAIAELSNIRKQTIDDVYQITGLADIMRGTTEASETLGAQQLKAQYGNVRIRDKQSELVRIARDAVRIGAEIMAEQFKKKTLLDMSQMELPTDADIKKQLEPLKEQADQIKELAEQAMAKPEIQQQMQENPEVAQQIIGKVEEQLQALAMQAHKIEQTVTIEKVMTLLRDQRLRPFLIDIETDSTIVPDENAQRQRVTEYLGTVGSVLSQTMPYVQQQPEFGPYVAEILRWTHAQFRVGRQMDQVMEKLAETLKGAASQPKPPPPEQVKAKAEAEAIQGKSKSDQQIAAATAQEKAAAAAQAQAEAQATALDTAARAAEEEHKTVMREIEQEAARAEALIRQDNLRNEDARANAKHIREMELKALDIEKKQRDIEAVGVKTMTGIVAAENSMANENAATDAGIAAQREGLDIKREATISGGAPS